MTKRCADCRFAVEVENDVSMLGQETPYQCRRGAPVPMLVPTAAHPLAGQSLGHSLTSVWPIVPAEGWCGDFKKRPAPIALDS